MEAQTITWDDRSNEDDGEQYRYLIPNVILADLIHFEFESWGESVDEWRLNLARFAGAGKMVVADHDLDEPDIDSSAAKAWAEPIIKEFMA